MIEDGDTEEGIVLSAESSSNKAYATDNDEQFDTFLDLLKTSSPPPSSETANPPNDNVKEKKSRSDRDIAVSWSPAEIWQGDDGATKNSLDSDASLDTTKDKESNSKSLSNHGKYGHHDADANHDGHSHGGPTSISPSLIDAVKYIGGIDPQEETDLEAAYSIRLHGGGENTTNNDSIERTEGRRNDFQKMKSFHQSKRAMSRLSMSEANSHIQPGRRVSSINDKSLEFSIRHAMRKEITLPKTIDFFRRVEMKLILVNVLISVALTTFVLYACPDSWQTRLKDASMSVSILGAFMSFALVFRTQTCYGRWWEARTMWGKMTSACVQLSSQARTWFGDEDLVDKFLMHCIVFPYACKAVLRKNQLNDSTEEGLRFVTSGMLTDADLGVIMQHGPPFVCMDIMRLTMLEALQKSNSCELPSAMLNGAFLAMEQVLFQLNLNFGACLKINSTRMPASYTVFMRSFVIFFFVLASLTWAPKIKWLTPILVGFMAFVINTVIVIGDQMMRPFDLQWSGLPLQKFCVIIEHEVMNVSRRYSMLNKWE